MRVIESEDKENLGLLVSRDEANILAYVLGEYIHNKITSPLYSTLTEHLDSSDSFRFEVTDERGKAVNLYIKRTEL